MVYFAGEELGRLLKRLGVPTNAKYRFRIGQRKYRLLSADIICLRHFETIFRGMPPHRSTYWLLPHRVEIRSIQRLRSNAALTLVATRTAERSVCLLAIWLWGRCGGHTGTDEIASFLSSSDTTVRKKAVRALARHQEWMRLTEIALRDPNPRIRTLATMPTRQEHGTLLDKFRQHLVAIPTESRHQELRVAEGIEIKRWQPLKPLSLIREILERIHRLVHGLGFESEKSERFRAGS